MTNQNRRIQVIVLLAALTILVSQVNAADVLYAQNFERRVRIAVVGDIEKGDFDKVNELIAKAIPQDSAVKLPTFYIELYSEGGDVVEASKIGAMARELFIGTDAPDLTSCNAVARLRGDSLSSFRWWPASADSSLACSCYSACFVAWAGGVNRGGGMSFGDKTYIGVHRARFGSEYFSGLSSREADTIYDQLLEDLNSYLARMDIPSSIVERMNNTPSSEMRMLSRAEIESISKYPPFIDEWLESKCVDKRLTQQESADRDELIIKYARSVGGGRGPELSSPESNYRQTLDMKHSEYSQCRHDAWSLEQAMRIRELVGTVRK